MAKLELSRELSLSAEQAWQHAWNLSERGAWLVMHEGWRTELPTDLGGRPLFGPIGAAAAPVVKGDIERSIQRFEDQYG